MTRFWEDTPLEAMTEAQWESLCDGCGRCCLVRFENGNGEGVFYTRAACRLLDTASCRCQDYAHRFDKVPDCLSVRKLPRENYGWLPVSCAYRLLAEGKPLPRWHPLVSGDSSTVLQAGISVAGRVVSEEYIHPDEIESLLLAD